MIYVELEGRIGNQIFMYAAARALQRRMEGHPKIVMDDRLVKRLGWENLLPEYNLPDVEYVSDKTVLRKANLLGARMALFLHRHIGTRIFSSFRSRYNFERNHQAYFNRHGLIRCENGYIPLPEHIEGDVFLSGFFQSEKYFADFREELLGRFRLEGKVEQSGYPGLEKILSRNSVCISIKVEHNVGSAMYDVCTREYWEKAIAYVTEHVENPLFFICSDNVPYVLEHFIDGERYDVVTQAADFPVHISLGVMARCRHFIIGNTSFGWWAQYLADNEDKIVVTPSRWYGIDVPCDIYQENWTRIEV